MPTALTHAVVGAALAPLAPGGARRARVAIGLAAVALLPDADVAGFAVGIPYGHPLGHRGFTHSLAFAALIGIAAGLAARRAPPRSRAALGALAFAACASHGLLDALTDAGLGIGLLLPFSPVRVFFPWRVLPTSPLSPAAFFASGGAAEILWVEAGRVWLPAAGLAGVLHLGRLSPRAAARLPGRRTTSAGGSE